MRRLTFVFAAIAIVSMAIQTMTPERVADAAVGAGALLLRELR